MDDTASNFLLLSSFLSRLPAHKSCTAATDGGVETNDTDKRANVLCRFTQTEMTHEYQTQMLIVEPSEHARATRRCSVLRGD